ncbi:MAG: DUF6230 family protein [Nocardioides sp.]
MKFSDRVASRARAGIDRSLADLSAKAGEMRDRSDAMIAASVVGRRGTKKRALVPIAAGGAALVMLFQMIAAQILAVNFTTSNTQMKLYSNYLDSQMAALYLAPTSKQNGNQTGVAELGIKTAKLAGLCVIKQEDIGVLGTYSFVITAGDDIADSYASDASALNGLNLTAAGALTGSSLAGAISANNLYINATDLRGYGNKISGLNLGQSADTVAASAGVTWPGGQLPTAGNFGLFAQQLNMAGLGGDTYGLNLAGDITLPKLNLRVVPGAKTQQDCS